jgi:hypothetical protein
MSKKDDLARRNFLLAAAGAAGLPIIGSQITAAEEEATQTPPETRARLRELIEGYRMTQMVHVAAKLRIADHLKSGPLTVKELARLTSTHEDSLYRLLRTLAGLGVFSEEDGPGFRLTPMADLLRSDVSGSLRVSAEVTGEPWMWRPWGHLMHSIKTGEVAFDNLYGKHTWDWFAENPGPAQLFNSLMDEGTDAETRAVLAGYDFGGAQTVVDIGGGRGVLLAAVLGVNTKVRGILFDLPHVIEDARKTLDSRVARRIEFVSGDFFKAVPSGGDLYLLKNIIHDWSDAESRQILAVLHHAMNGRGRILLVEHLICEPNKACRGKFSDIQMMVRNGGRNRTDKEYRNLLRAGGFNVTRVVPTAGPDIVEGIPA